MRDNRPMERGWERRYSFAELSTGQLERLVGLALPGAVVAAARPLTGGLRNTNYRIELVDGPVVVLRLYLADAAACAREAALLAAMAGRVPVPRVFYSDPAAEPPWALTEWLDGSPMHEVLDDVDAATAIELASTCGSALAAIHELRFPEPGFLGPNMSVVQPMSAWAAVVLEALAGDVAARLGPELAAAVRKAVASNANRVEAVWSEAVLVHADYKPWNLLVGRAAAKAVRSSPGPWRLTGILDWEFACAGCKLIDFATFLRDDYNRPAGFTDAFASAYLGAGGTLPDDWRRLTRLVDILNLVQMLRSGGRIASDDLARLLALTIASA